MGSTWNPLELYAGLGCDMYVGSLPELRVNSLPHSQRGIWDQLRAQMVNNKWHKPDIIKLPNAREERAEVGSEEVLLSPNICSLDTVCLVAKLGPRTNFKRGTGKPV